MKKPSFGVWAVLITAIVLIGLCVATVCLGGRLVTTENGVVVLQLAEPEIVQFRALSTPEPTAAPIVLPEGAVDVLIDAERIALTLGSRAEAEALLQEYLSACMEERRSETERPLSARFACTVYLLEASGTHAADSYDDALALLQKTPALIPVEVVTEERVVSAGTPGTDSHDDPAIAKGSKMYTQLGCGAQTVTTTVRTYRGGALADTGTPQQQVEWEARQSIVRIGTYRSDEPKGEPDRKQGPEGKDAGELKLSAPIRGSISSFFGTRRGLMHAGIDIPAKAGTEIRAPGEGLVVFIGQRAEYGTVIDIDHGGGFVSRLTHCENVQVERNQRVFLGDPVATLAARSNSTGKPHLHYELLIDGVPYNPLYYLD